MVRGTFANIRLKNQLVPDVEGGVTLHLPEGERMPIYNAAMRYKRADVPLLVIAGKEYGSGSSRDWAAKGALLLGIEAVLAESFERIHRSNLVGMGVLPLQFKPGENVASLALTGREVFDITGIDDSIRPRAEVTVTTTGPGGARQSFQAVARLDSAIEVNYYRNGGILPAVLRSLLKK
jgi:aconitate hydratase